MTRLLNKQERAVNTPTRRTNFKSVQPHFDLQIDSAGALEMR